MLTRSQLLILTAMATLGVSFAGFLAVGIAIGDITLALINLGVIVALLSCAFVIGSGGGENTAKKLEDDSLNRDIYLQAIAQRKEYDRILKGLDKYTYDRQGLLTRAGEMHVGGELNPEFKN